MSQFYDFLKDRLKTGGFSTEDTLVAVLPLIRETLEAHHAGQVAPLVGIGDLCVEGVRIWFEEAKRRDVRRNAPGIRRIEAASRAAVEVVAESRRTTDVDDGRETLIDLDIGDADEHTPAERPVYLPGYLAWEHTLGHHDPLTDVFSLGMILASLACGLDFHNREELGRFVKHRRNLFPLKPDLHPVLARAIVRMTEIDRHRRVQDLSALRHTLEHYRDQDIDFEYDLARIEGFDRKDRHTKQNVVLTKLRERLFEISRRNRLLHFRPTMQTVNLSHASVPLSFDIRNIRPDQILVWNDAIQQMFLKGKPVSLNKHLNFSEALYLPPVLDRILAESRRDQAEFGFAQLRLAVCFLHWANLKEQPIEQYDSPLVLLPVRLKKQKGIRDTYSLSVSSSDAAVNPVLRHMFKQLYDIDLPEQIDLTQTTLVEFYEFLLQRIQSSDSAVELQLIDRPRIALIHEKAKRKLDQYRRRARIAGRGVRTFLDLDYSYDPANYNPLGVKLFAAKVRSPETRLRRIIEENPRPRTFVAPQGDPPVVEKQRSFYQLREGGEENPYTWTFDLCSVTLANFRYRRMSLVRDYNELLDDGVTSAGFEAVFSLSPRPAGGEPLSAPPLDSRFDVVPCDPTQATAIAQARHGDSYIIQGPPGTGKSQTITNLIADYVGLGKRVLFVCEKRAAIDVVYARLRQCGMSDLCCLIHDSQTDKKAFVMNLKQTYESFLAEGKRRRAKGRRSRKELLAEMDRELRSLEAFAEAMCDTTDKTGISVRDLIARCAELRERQPELTSLENERLPWYADWQRHRDQIAQYESTLAEVQPDRVLANHPLRLLSADLAAEDRPLEKIATALGNADKLLGSIAQRLEATGLSIDADLTLEQIKSLTDYACRVSPVASVGQMALLGTDSEATRQFSSLVRRLQDKRRALDAAREANSSWRHKPPRREAEAALQQAKELQKSMLPWLKPAWWRLRGTLNRAYDFRSHLVRPTWSQVLLALEKEYALADELDEMLRRLSDRYGIGDQVEDWTNRCLEIRDHVRELPAWIQEIHEQLVASQQAGRTVHLLLEAAQALESLNASLASILDDHHDCTLKQMQDELDDVEEALDDLPDILQCMSDLRTLPQEVRRSLRKLRLTPVEIEAAVADKTLQEVYREDRGLARFTSNSRNRHAQRLERLYDEWLSGNAGEVRERVKRQFLEHVHTASLPAAQLEPEQKEFKKTYNRGRRQLEHEFGKTMRYKPIRDLVADETGEVVKDLKPVWLMSPLSVSDTLPLDPDYFDVVIFDEASQITLEEAVPSLFRAAQNIVVGDEMQLPPTDFFSARRGDEDELWIEEGDEVVQYDLESNSFLNHSSKNLASTMLGWHYRSRSESLISFSNWMFYDGRLLTVPEEQLPVERGEQILVEDASSAERFIDALLQRAISFHRIANGVYEKRRNRAEADYIAGLVRGLLLRGEGLSIGVVAFSEAQQDEIENALQRLAHDDDEFQALLDAELEREEGGQFVGLLVKNLENIQGDERDVVILSVCYGYGPNGKMLMNFGPINRSGGEKRLNVAFSRAKHHMVVVSSIQYSDITNEHNDGANCLRNYLRYADAISAGHTEQAERILLGMHRWQDPELEVEDEVDDPIAVELATALRERGYVVDFNVGQSHFRCDLAVRRESDAIYRLGIMLDSPNYYEQDDILERDMMRPKLLRVFGWRAAIVLAKDWCDDPQAVMDRLIRLIDGGDDQADAGDDPIDLDDPLADEAVSSESVLDEDEAANASPPHESTDVDALVLVACQRHYLELISDRSRKFWEITVEDCEHTVRFGRIGSRGQSLTRRFETPETARQDADRLIRQKRNKGYQEK